jgi:hypothetical protein
MCLECTSDGDCKRCADGFRSSEDGFGCRERNPCNLNAGEEFNANATIGEQCTPCKAGYTILFGKEVCEWCGSVKKKDGFDEYTLTGFTGTCQDLKSAEKKDKRSLISTIGPIVGGLTAIIGLVFSYFRWRASVDEKEFDEIEGLPYIMNSMDDKKGAEQQLTQWKKDGTSDLNFVIQKKYHRNQRNNEFILSVRKKGTKGKYSYTHKPLTRRRRGKPWKIENKLVGEHGSPAFTFPEVVEALEKKQNGFGFVLEGAPNARISEEEKEKSPGLPNVYNLLSHKPSSDLEYDTEAPMSEVTFFDSPVNV